MSESVRCSAPLKTRAWYPYDERYKHGVARCPSKAKPGSLFCGTHKWLAEQIESIVWKEDYDG